MLVNDNIIEMIKTTPRVAQGHLDNSRNSAGTR